MCLDARGTAELWKKEKVGDGIVTMTTQLNLLHIYFSNKWTHQSDDKLSSYRANRGTRRANQKCV